MYYAGIGSRSAPIEVLDLCCNIGNKLAQLGYTCRTGGAIGCDTAFIGVSKKYESYYVDGALFTEEYETKRVNSRQWEEAEKFASQYHPNWNNLGVFAKGLHTRNVFQLKGTNEVNSSFVVCWTPDGAQTAKETSRKTGGTGQCIRMADALSIPVFNIKNEDSRKRLVNWLEKKE